MSKEQEFKDVIAKFEKEITLLESAIKELNAKKDKAVDGLYNLEHDELPFIMKLKHFFDNGGGNVHEEWVPDSEVIRELIEYYEVEKYRTMNVFYMIEEFYIFRLFEVEDRKDELEELKLKTREELVEYFENSHSLLDFTSEDYESPNYKYGFKGNEFNVLCELYDTKLGSFVMDW
jgi:hypothetical protein